MVKVSRRTFIAGVGLTAMSGLAVGAMVPMGRIDGAQAEEIMGAAPKLPNGLRPYLETFKNWAEDIVADEVWTCTVNSPNDVVLLANWAHKNGWKIRPRGHMHNWSPISISGNETAKSKVLMVNTRQGLTRLTVNTGSTPSVTVGTGVDQEVLLNRLHDAGYGILHHPAPGDITVGGMLAIGGHGTGVPAVGEKRLPGQTYGSLCNLIMALKAVVWDPTRNAYVLKTFKRNDRAIAPLLLHLGRAFITEVTLRVGPQQNLRCQSYTDVPMSELMAPQGSGGRTIASYLDSAGRLEVILFPFTTRPWLKVWTVTPNKPFWTRAVSGPFNYPFSDNVDKNLANMMRDIATGAVWMTPTSGSVQLSVVRMGLFATWSNDMWGSSKDLLMYVKPDTLRVTANGYAVLCRRADVQRVMNDFYKIYQRKNSEYAQRQSYPMNGPLEIRVVGLDDPSHCGVPGAQDVWLSPTRRAPDNPQWDTAVYFDILTFPNTPDSEKFYKEVEDAMYATYTGSYARVRVEWSKGWGYSETAAWGNDAVVQGKVRQMTDQGQPDGTKFADAVRMLNGYDPGRVFSTTFHDRLMPAKI